MKPTDQASSGCQLCQDGSVIENQRSSLSPELRSASDPIVTMSAIDEATFAALRIRWFGLHPNQPMGDEMILRFARAHRFHEQRAWAAMRNLDCRYLSLSARGLERQLKKRLVFPLPSILTKDGHECFYMRHSRFHPEMSPVEDAIDPLVYVINTMNEKECNMRNGITLISNFDGWTVDQCSMEYFAKLVAVLQGGVVPVNISSWLIVNAPPSFNEIFAGLKRMMTAAFQRRVHIITDSALAKGLQRGYRNHLPRDMAKGRAITKEIVSDFVDARVYIETIQDCTSETTVGKVKPRDVAQVSASTKEFLLDFVDARRYIDTLQTFVAKGIDFHASQSSTDVTFDCSMSFHDGDLLL